MIFTLTKKEKKELNEEMNERDFLEIEILKKRDRERGNLGREKEKTKEARAVDRGRR